MTQPESEGPCPIAGTPGKDRPRSFREVGLWALLGLCVLIYFVRLGERPVRHEEPLRGQVAVEMFMHDDFIVPREQGLPFLSRPPLQNWSIAVASALVGHNAFAIRLPSALAVLAMVLILYLYTRRFLSPLGAFAAGAVYCSMGQVLELGRKGETDAFFTLWVSASLLIWHAGASRGRLTWRTWVLAYVFVACGTLTKGPQAPFYFAGSVGLYMLLTRRWRELVTPAHAAGILCWLFIVLLWVVPFWWLMGLDGLRAVFFGDVGLRFDQPTAWTLFRDSSLFPPRVFASMLPWSILLLAYLSRSFRSGIGACADPVRFLIIVIAVTLPTCWFIPFTTPRYFMPLYPCIAVLIAIVVQRAAETQGVKWRRIWIVAQRMLAGVAIVVAVGLVGARIIGPSLDHRYAQAFEQPIALVVVCSIVSGLCARALWQSSRQHGVRAAYRALVAVLVLEGTLFSVLLTDIYLATSASTAVQIAKLRQVLPEGTVLVSLGRVDPVFTHYLGELVPRLDAEGDRFRPSAEVDYFVWSPVFSTGTKDALGFEWDEIAVINCDFSKKEVTQHPVYVGRVRR